MSADVKCMSLASVPAGEQRARFLAVGLDDNTVRIISLDQSVSVLRWGVCVCGEGIRGGKVSIVSKGHHSPGK